MLYMLNVFILSYIFSSFSEMEQKTNVKRISLPKQCKDSAMQTIPTLHPKRPKCVLKIKARTGTKSNLILKGQF